MNISDSVIEEAILDAGSPFDSHKIILALAHNNQRAYVEALNAAEGESPFQTLHSALGRRIKAVSERFGYLGEPHRSADIFGQESNCVLWSRR